MNRRPGQVNVTTEVGFCGFCGRPRTLRTEEHQLGTLVRTIVTCETCHRTLSSEIGVAQPAPVAAEAPPAEQPVDAPASTEAQAAKPERATAAKKAAVKKPAVMKPAATKPAVKKPVARGGKPTSTATRKSTRTK